MDFFGFRELQHDPWMSDTAAAIVSEIGPNLIFDMSCRRKFETQRKLAVMHGVLMISPKVISPLTAETSAFVHYGLISDLFLDEYDVYMRINLAYRTCRPYCLYTHKGLEFSITSSSFRKWLTSRLKLIQFCSPFSISTHFVTFGQMSMIDFNPWLEPLMRNFLDIPPEMTRSNELTYFALPLIRNLKQYSKLLQEWLMLMEWWKLINNKLLPTYHILHLFFKQPDVGMPSPLRHDMEEVEDELRLLILECGQFKNYLNTELVSNILKDKLQEYFLPAGYLNDIDIRCRELDNKSSRLLIGDLFVFSVNTARSTIDHLLKISKKVEANLCKVKITFGFSIFIGNVMKLTSKVRQLIKGRQIVIFSDTDLVKDLMNSIAKVLNFYSKKKLFITSEFGDELELDVYTLERIRKFVQHIIYASNFAAIKFLSQLLPSKIFPKESVARIAKSVTKLLTNTAKRNILKSMLSKYSSVTLSSQDKLVRIINQNYECDEKKFLPIGVLEELQKVVDGCSKDCFDNLFDTNRDRENHTDFPLEDVDYDFENFKRGFSNFFYTGPQPLENMDHLTNGRLKNFMNVLFTKLVKSWSFIENILRKSEDLVDMAVNQDSSSNQPQKFNKIGTPLIIAKYEPTDQNESDRKGIIHPSFCSLD